MLRALVFALVLAVPAAAFAEEPRPERPRAELSASAYSGGAGVRAGLRMRWLGLEAGIDSKVTDDRSYLGLEIAPLPDQAVSPYAYGRLGTWERRSELESRSQNAPYVAFGGGLALHATDTLFFLFELGATRDMLGSPLELEARLGIGLRFQS